MPTTRWASAASARSPCIDERLTEPCSAHRALQGDALARELRRRDADEAHAALAHAVEVAALGARAAGEQPAPDAARARARQPGAAAGLDASGAVAARCGGDDP